MTHEEINAFIEQYGDAVYSFCVKLTNNPITADDLFQDTFLKVLELHKKIMKEDNPKSYMMGIALNLWRNQKRKNANRNRILPQIAYQEEQFTASSTPPVPEDEILRREQYKAVQKAVNQLSDELRETMLLFYTAELSVANIAKIQKIPQGTVKRRLHQGRKLAKEFLEEGYENGRK